jgi:hypothetical protein
VSVSTDSLLLLADVLPEIDETSQTSLHNSTSNSTSTKSLSAKRRARLERQELHQFKVVQKHAVFAANPLATLKEHLSSNNLNFNVSLIIILIVSKPLLKSSICRFFLVVTQTNLKLNLNKEMLQNNMHKKQQNVIKKQIRGFKKL